MLAISTEWKYKKDVNLKQMLADVKSAGLSAIELGYQWLHPQLEELIPLLAQENVSVSSIHNFCPVPFDEPSPRHSSNYYRVSSVDEAERQKAVLWTQKSIDTAARVGAKVVVLHAGTVEAKGDLTSEFLHLARQDKRGTPEFSALREKLLKIRRDNRGPYIAALEKSFREILPYAQKKGIKIGLETRYYPMEIPNHEEIGYFLKLFFDQGLYFWHDVGHGEVNSRLGITSHMDYLRDYEKYLIGMHIHGIQGIKDHFAPFEGDFDLNSIKDFIKKAPYQVIESHSTASIELIQKAVLKLSEF